MPPALSFAFAFLLATSALAAKPAANPRTYAGFDANDYPGDALLPALRHQFDFVGYWLTNPPLTSSNPWVGKRDILLRNGFGFLVLANGRFYQQILESQKAGISAAALARQDAATAVAAARREGFPARTVLFLDQEDGGRMVPEQAAYILGWTEAVAASGFRPGVYASGIPVNDGKGPDGKAATITTIQDIRDHVAAQHLHPIAFWVYQDTCPPAPGCVVSSAPPALDLSGTIDATAWQYAKSPRNACIARSGAATYRNGNCYAPGVPGFALDLDLSTSSDPSQGR